MSRRNFRGIISSSKLTISNVSASGIFTTNSHLQAKNSGNWPLGANPTNSIEYLVVSGGGSGAGHGTQVGGGGGGAGGLLTGNTSVSGSIVYTVTVGAGGAGVATNLSGNYGSNTSISGTGLSVSTIGGGRGSFWRGDGPGNGGSGGGTTGAQQDGISMVAGKGIYPGSTYLSQTRQGYDGALGTGQLGANACTGGGGGGAGAAGSGASGGTGFTSSISGTSTTYASGGNGSAGSFSSGVYSSTSGAGGGGGTGSFSQGGGNGIVILRYLSSFDLPISTTGSPTITTAGGYRIYTWTSSGSITF